MAKDDRFFRAGGDGKDMRLGNAEPSSVTGEGQEVEETSLVRHFIVGDPIYGTLADDAPWETLG